MGSEGVADRVSPGDPAAGAWRARLEAGGVDALDSVELLALVLGGARPRPSAGRTGEAVAGRGAPEAGPPGGAPVPAADGPSGVSEETPASAAGPGEPAAAGSGEYRAALARAIPRASAAGLRAGATLLDRADLVELSVLPWDELCSLEGLGRARALRLAAAFALGRRVERAGVPARCSMRSPSQVHRLLAPEFRGAQRESFLALLLDGKHRLRRREVVSVGTLTSSLVHPREFFRPAVREAAAAVIAVHNHPSGDPEPSPEDLEVTRRLVDVGRLLGVPLLDHVVIGAGRYVSLKERLGW